MIKKIIGFSMMDSAIYLFLAAKGYIEGRGAPIVVNGVQSVEAYINPIPSGLVLTGIVVSVSVSALMLALTVLFMTNSANLQDGIDGILSSVTSVGCMGWAVIAGLSAVTVYQHLNGGSFGIPMVKIPDDPDAARALQDNYSAIAIFAAALCGGCLGFLRYNRYPAKVFMGDTGSMFIGGAVVGMAMLLRQPFLLLLIGFTCCMSSVSVILQRYYYKATRKIYGTPRRLFKMSPLHHHFEKCGMKETQIVLMYTVVTLVLTALAVISVIV